MSNERQKLLDYIDKKNPVKCIDSIHGCTTFDDISAYFEGSTFIEQVKQLGKSLEDRAAKNGAKEIRVPADIASALIVGCSIIIPHEGINHVDAVGYLGSALLVVEPHAASIKFYA